MIGSGSTPCRRRDIRKWCSWGGRKPMLTVTSDCWMLDVASLELPVWPRSNVGKSSLINSLLHRTVQLSTDLVELFQARSHDGAHFQDFSTLKAVAPVSKMPGKTRGSPVTASDGILCGFPILSAVHLTAFSLVPECSRCSGLSFIFTPSTRGMQHFLR